LKIPKGNQNQYIEEEQTIQWPKEKVQKDKQRFTNHTYKTKDRVTRTQLKTGGKTFPRNIYFYAVILTLYEYIKRIKENTRTIGLFH
jgi:hypothetical protein